MTRITVVTVFNSLDLVSHLIGKSLGNQRLKDYEFIRLDNCENAYSSMSSAYNAAALRAEGELVIFCHQDVELLDANCLETLWGYYSRFQRQYEHFAIGAMGAWAFKNRFGIVTRRLTRAIGYLEDYHTPAGAAALEPTRVQTLDEGLIALPGRTARSFPFVETAFAPWDFYTTLLTYHLGVNGFPSFVVPVRVNHAPSMKFIPQIGTPNPEVRLREYARNVFERMERMYLATGPLESQLIRTYGPDLPSNPICCCGSRFPIPSLRLRTFRDFIYLSSRSSVVHSFLEPLAMVLDRLRISQVSNLSVPARSETTKQDD